MRKILFFILLAFLVCCEWSPSVAEKAAVLEACKPLCHRIGSKAYNVDGSVNGFGCVFHYKCYCYPIEGIAEPITIIIKRKDIRIR
jgi:hypothetical protein